MNEPLRVLLTADPDLPVPPTHYGGIERIVALLAEGLTDRGHDVVLLAHRDSTAPGRLVAYPRQDERPTSRLLNAVAIGRAASTHRPHLIHSFGRLASLAMTMPMRLPKIMSYQREITPRSITWGARLGRGRVTFAACSHDMVARVRDLAAWQVIYNAVDLDRYDYAATVAEDAPLVFLGRVEAIKGPHLAIEIARRVGRRLVIAGNVPVAHRDYFETEIRPWVDGRRVQYLGPVDDAAKNELLADAAALLMPILWEEPFGIVMAEALACGTPVIGLARGAVPEVVSDGVTGFVCADVAAMIGAVGQVGRIDRRACRAAAESRFSPRVLVDSYEALYREVVMATDAHPVAAAATDHRSVTSGGGR